MNKTLSLCCFLLAAACIAANALDMNSACQFDGIFYEFEVMVLSADDNISRKLRLDNRISDFDYRLPVCPECGVPLIIEYRYMSDEKKNLIKEYIGSDSFRSLPKGYPGNYYLANIFENTEFDPGTIALAYKEAGFEAETCYPELAEEMKTAALGYYEKALQLFKPETGIAEGYAECVMNVSDLQRQLRMFDWAKETIQRLKADDKKTREFIRVELLLINKEDAAPHYPDDDIQ